jgi:Kef-type K+ transport system membrane component KefB
MTARAVVAYALLLAVAAGLFLLVRQQGERLSPPAGAVSGAAASVGQNPSGEKKVEVLFHVLVTLTAVIIAGQALAWLLRPLGQAPVICEVIAGIMLGPSLLGRLSPGAMQWFIPDRAADPDRLVETALKVIAQLGIVLYMFLIGLELNPRKLGGRLHAAVAISHASIVAPFLLGSGAALWLFPRFAPAGTSFTGFALFLGAAMSITAFPMLARILKDRGLSGTELGVIAVSCAAIDDVTAWCLLALAIGVVRSQVAGALLVSAWSALFMLAMFVVVRPLMQRCMRWLDERHAGTDSSPSAFGGAGLLVAALAAAACTEAIGINAVFGGFLLGVVIPHDSRVAIDWSRRLHPVVNTLLLPAFFAVTGMNTQIQLIAGWEAWLTCLAIIAIATAGKYGGTVGAARIAGLDWPSSHALGVLMNTRGLMELIVLNVGLQLGVIEPRLYAMMVLMALATTMVAAPLLQWILPPGTPAAEA